MNRWIEPKFITPPIGVPFIVYVGNYREECKNKILIMDHLETLKKEEI